MSDTAFHHLEGKSNALAYKIAENPDVVKVMAGLLGLIVLECKKRGVPLTAIRMGELQSYGDGEFRSHVTYLSGGLWTPVLDIPAKTEFMEYLAWKGIALAKVLEMNVSVAALFEKLTSRLEQWAAFRGIPFKELRVHEDGAFLSQDNDLVIRVERGQRKYDLREVKKGYSKP